MVVKKTSFILRFTLLFAVTYPLVVFLEIRPYEEVVANIVSVLLSVLSVNHQVLENNILMGGTAFSVDPSCTGFVSVALLLAVVLSPGIINSRQQARVFLSGSFFLLAWNIMRVFLLVIAGPLMELLHFTLWMISGTFIIWLWYTEIVKKCGIPLD